MASDSDIYEALFVWIDKDADGKVTREDMVEVWGKVFGFPEKEIDEMMSGASSVDVTAFKLMMKKMKPDTSVQLAIEAFGVFEAAPGTIQCAQFERDMKKGDLPLSAEQCRAFCRDADITGDGSFDYKAFVTYAMDSKNCVTNVQETDSMKPIERLVFGEKKKNEDNEGATKSAS